MTTKYSVFVLVGNTNLPYDWDFSGIKYFNNSYWNTNYIFVIVEDAVSERIRHACDEYGNDVTYTENSNKVIGVAEVGDFYEKAWLSYISVSEEFQGKGFAKILYQKIAEYMKDERPGEILYRTSPSASSPNFFKEVADKWLNEAGIKWVQEV